MIFIRVIPPEDFFLVVGKPSTKIRWIINFLYKRKLIILINNRVSDPISLFMVFLKVSLFPIILFLFVSDIL